MLTGNTSLFYYWFFLQYYINCPNRYFTGSQCIPEKKFDHLNRKKELLVYILSQAFVLKHKLTRYKYFQGDWNTNYVFKRQPFSLLFFSGLRTLLMSVLCTLSTKNCLRYRLEEYYIM